MEDKDRNPPDREPTANPEDQPTLDGIPSPAPAGLAARYDLLSELGRGGMGIVYKARDRETGAIVALKVLRAEIAADAQVLERFKNEVLLARKITHKSVCRIHELLRFGGTVAISMEFVEGESLRHILKRFHSLSLRKGMEVAQQICAGLQEAHSQGVVHRDLKPENVMLDPAGQVKIMDFGIARSTEGGLTQAGALLGTPAYMSPEQAGGKGADPRSDIYSLGLVMYELFTGQSAFRADTPIALALKQIQETPPPPRQIDPYLPEFLDRAIRKCLEKEPGKRFRSAEELGSALTATAEPSEAAEAAPEREALPEPAEFAQWQALDSWLFGGALLAAIAFLFLFARVYPYAWLRIHIGQEEAVEKAVALVRKFEPAAANGRAEPAWRWWLGDRRGSFFTPVPEIQQAVALIFRFEASSRWWLLHYPAKVRALGLPEANRQLLYDEYWEVRVDLGPGRDQARVALRTDGSLCYLRLPPRPGNQAVSPFSPEQAKRDGIAYVRQIFGTDVSNLKPELHHLREVTDILWELPGPTPDLKRTIGVRLGHDGLLGIEERFPSRHGSEIDKQWVPTAVQEILRVRVGAPGGAVLFLMWTLMLALSFFRGLYRHAGRSAVLAALCFTLAIGGMWLQDRSAEAEPLLAAAGAAGYFLLAFFLLATAEDYLWRRLRSRVATWFLLVRRPGEARAAGLGILRGCALGLIYLAVHTLIMDALGSAKLSGPSTLWMETAALSGRPYLGLWALSWAVLDTILRAWCLVAFPAALASGITRRPFALVGVPAALWALGPAFNIAGTVPSFAWAMLLIAALQAVAFSLVFYRYDLLTLACAIFTVEVWLLVYPVWTIFSAIQPLQPSLAMMPWFLLLLAGAIIYLRPQLQAARRQIAAVFE